MLQDMWNVPPGFRPSVSAPSSPAKPMGLPRTRSESFHVTHKVPFGDSPYVRAKNVQLIEKDPEKAIPLFWAAINAGDRVDSALKDMAIVMKQQNRAEEAIEAIKSLRSRCSDQAQESIDNILLDLYKRCGRLDDQIALLRHKLFLIDQGMAFNGKRTKTARSQGKKFQVSVEQEATRLLGNLGWALMQQNNYIEAEDAYRRALAMTPDNNKMCNLGICLMKQGRILEAKKTLRRVKPAVSDGPRGADSHLKAFERAQQMLCDLESEMLTKVGDRVEQSRLFDACFGSSSLWQPQPCKEHPTTNTIKSQDEFGDENVDSNRFMNHHPTVLSGPKIVKPRVDHGNLLNASIWQPQLGKDHRTTTTTTAIKSQDDFRDENTDANIFMNHNPMVLGQKIIKPVAAAHGNSLNVAAMPFYSSKMTTGNLQQESLKRTRSEHAANATGAPNAPGGQLRKPLVEYLEPENKSRRRSLSPEENGDKWWAGLLPDSQEFEAALIAAAVVGTATETEKKKKTEETGKVLQDISSKV